MPTSKLEARLSSGSGPVVLDAILETTPSIALIVDETGKVVRVSRHACEIAGRTAEEMEGLTADGILALFKPTDLHGQPLTAERLPVTRALKGEHVLGVEGYFIDAKGEQVPIVSNVAPIYSPGGGVIGAVNSITDLRAFRALEGELRATAAEKDMLFHELAHRVKNHLHIMSGLVGLEARGADPAVAAMAERIQGRLNMLAAVYDRMNQAEIGGNIEARAFLEDVVLPYATDGISMAVVAPPETTLSRDQAGPLGMLVNEAVCNAYKHAFPGRKGRIEVALRPGAPGRLRLEVSDDGVGGIGEIGDGPSHGMKLMRQLAGQLEGALEAGERPEGGARIAVDLPAAPTPASS